jgi:hypothetical protein
VDQPVQASGTARSLIQTSDEALRFPAGTPRCPNSDPSSRHMPAAVMRRSVATSACPRRPDRSALGSGMATVAGSDQRWQVQKIPHLVQGSRKRAGEAS